ncbi:MAG: Lrp/AsnC family transcriptional regulator [Candidatus Woesearchaeota archaeon]
MRVTNADLKILHALSLNARASLTDLAKKTKMSKQALSYRMKLLQESGILVGTQAVVNTYALGEAHFRLFIKFRNMTAVQEDDFYRQAQENKEISWYAICDGDFDSAIIFWAKTIREFEQAYKELIASFGKYFAEMQFSIANEIHYLKHNFLTGSHDSGSFRFGTVEEKPDLDALDMKILSELNKDARKSLVDIAASTNTSVKLVHDRIKKMQQKNVILGFNTLIDHKKLGFTHRKVQMWLNDTSAQSIKQLSGYLREQPSTIFLVSSLGGPDFEFEIMTRTNEEYHTITKKLRTAFPQLIARYGGFIIYEEPKRGML